MALSMHLSEYYVRIVVPVHRGGPRQGCEMPLLPIELLPRSADETDVLDFLDRVIGRDRKQVSRISGML